jgi:hypothetical protein
MDGVEGASDLVRCEDVRSCAIDYAIRRDWTDIVVAMMGFGVGDGRRMEKSTLKKVILTGSGSMGLTAHSRLRCQGPASAYRLAWLWKIP